MFNNKRKSSKKRSIFKYQAKLRRVRLHKSFVDGYTKPDRLKTKVFRT